MTYLTWTELLRDHPLCCVCQKPYVEGQGRSSLEDRWAHEGCARTRTTREKLPCHICGYVRTVTVRYYALHGERHFNTYCSACKLEAAARKHEAAAIKQRRAALAIRSRRAQK